MAQPHRLQETVQAPNHHACPCVLIVRTAGAGWAVEDHDVPPSGLVEAVGQLGDHHPVAHQELGAHGGRGDGEGLSHEGPQHQGDHGGHDQQDDRLGHEGPGGTTSLALPALRIR